MPDTGSACPLCNATVKLLGKRLKYIGGACAYIYGSTAITSASTERALTPILTAPWIVQAFLNVSRFTHDTAVDYYRKD
jgi:hypothetical protein